MFNFKFQKPKIDKNSLITAIDAGLNTDAQTADELISQTGKSRQEILSICLADDEVESCREDLEGAIIASEWRIYDDVAKGTQGLDEETLNRLYKIVRTHITDFANLAILAKFNGYAVAEYVYKVEEDGFLTLNKVLSKDGELDKYTPKRDGSVIYDSDKGEIAIDQIAKFLVLKNKAVPARPMGEMMIVKAYPAVSLRRKEWAYAGQFITRYAQPYVVGKQGAMGSIVNFTSKIFGFINGGAMGIGADDEISIHQLSGNGDAFDTIERLCNRRIQKMLLGRVKTSELSGGSRSAQETDDEARQDRVKSYLALMVQAVQHALNALMVVNAQYGKAINAPQGLWFEYVEQSKVDRARAERDKLYMDTGQVKLTKEYMMDMVGYEEHHFEMIEPSTPTPSAMPPSTPLSLQLSDKHDHSHDHMPLTAKQSKIAGGKADKILALMNDVDDFNDFQKRLERLDLSDDGFVDELARQNTQAYLDGLTGKANKDGEMGID